MDNPAWHAIHLSLLGIRQRYQLYARREHISHRLLVRFAEAEGDVTNPEAANVTARSAQSLAGCRGHQDPATADNARWGQSARLAHGDRSEWPQKRELAAR